MQIHRGVTIGRGMVYRTVRYKKVNVVRGLCVKVVSDTDYGVKLY